MKRDYPSIPYEIFLSELYIDLKEYYHPERKKTPVFRIYTENLRYIITRIEEFSNNKIKIDTDESRLVNYNFRSGDSQIMIYAPLVHEELYPPYFHPNWRKYIKDGIQSYLFESPMSGIVEFFNKEDIKMIKESIKADSNPYEEEVTVEDIPVKKSLIKRIFWWLND